MANKIDFLTFEESPEENPEYPYTLEAYDYGNKPSGGCRCKSKDDLRTMYQLWKETYGVYNLKYYFKKNDKEILL